MKGIYLLLIGLPEKQKITVGSLGNISFPAGHYVYIGSALGGFKSRLNRHLRKEKLTKWHIDYLLRKASLQDIIICETEERLECAVAQALGRRLKVIPRFGSSDCRCEGHLFFSNRTNEKQLLASLRSLGLSPRLLGDSKAII